MKSKWVLPALAILFFAILSLPVSAFGIPGLTILEQRVIAIFVLAACLWVTEPIPVHATSVLIIFLELVFLSDKGLVWLKGKAGAADFGTAMGYKGIMATFSSPIILLFLGGFFLAMAATKYRLDINLARVLLKPFGNKPGRVLLGLMTITAMFSMFMSNTASTAMMLAILAPVLREMPEGDRGRLAFALGIPFAANLGGIGTPIGTPPNAVAMKYLSGELAIGFGTWMAIAVPFVILMLLFAWQLLLRFFPPGTERIELTIKGTFQKNWKARTVYAIFVITIVMWMSDAVHGLNAYTVALLPVVVFSSSGIITAKDMRELSWDVLWLVAGGIALGLAMEETGLARHLIEAIPFASFPPVFIVLGTTLVALTMATFMSHTATANLILPLVAALGTGVENLRDVGGAQMVILAVTFACSLAMSLAISTPPNALAQATGYFSGADLRRSGMVVGIVGLLGTYALMALLFAFGFFVKG